jgi:hypothetical protein
MKKIASVSALFILCLFLSSCSGKLTTIRPTLITRMVVENMVTGEIAEHLRDEYQEMDWLMDDLIFQMERQFNQEGRCQETDAHVYYAQFYMQDKLELSVYIHEDGSVCKNGKHYFPVEQNDESYDAALDLSKWEEFLGFSK